MATIATSIVPGPRESFSVADGRKPSLPGINQAFGVQSIVEGVEPVLFGETSSHAEKVSEKFSIRWCYSTPSGRTCTQLFCNEVLQNFHHATTFTSYPASSTLFNQSSNRLTCSGPSFRISVPIGSSKANSSSSA